VALAGAAVAQPSNATVADNSSLHTIHAYATLFTGPSWSTDVTVTLYLRTGDAVAKVATLDEPNTPGSGYTFDVPDGTYLLKGTVPGGYYDPEWLTDSPAAAGATPLVVAGADVWAPDLVMDPMARVTGRVVDEHGAARRGVLVQVYRHDENPDVDDDVYPIASTRSEGDGLFHLTTGRGDFRIAVRGLAPWRTQQTWLPEQDSFDAGEVVRVSADTELGDVVLSDGGTISGTVTSSLGGPAPGVRVGYVDSLGHLSYGTITDSEGRYQLVGQAGGVHHITIGGGASFVPQTRDVELTHDQHLTGVDAVLSAIPTTVPEGTDVTGRVVDGLGRPVPDVHINVQMDPGTGSHGAYYFHSVMTTTDAYGIFHLTQMDAAHFVTPGRPYLLAMELPDWDDDADYLYDVYAGDDQFEYQPTWYSDATWSADATVLHASADPVDLGDLVLSRQSGSISGEVWGYDGRAPSGRTVQAWDSEGRIADESPVWSDGTYRLRGLPAGTYYVRFQDDMDNPDWGPWWPESTFRSGAEPVQVTAGQRSVGIDLDQREPFRRVSGVVTYPSGQPVVHTWVAAFLTGDHPDQDYPVDGGYGYTGPDGRFTMRIPVGTYDLHFSDRNYGADPLDDQRYRDDQVTPLVVAAGADTQQLGQVHVSPYPSISGRITDQLGHPAQALINITRPGQTLPAWSGSPAANGHYDIDLTRSEGGTYTVAYYLGDYRPEAYPDSHATYTQTVTLGAETQLTIDQQAISPSPPATPPPATPPPASARLASRTVLSATYHRAGVHRGARLTLKISVLAGADLVSDGSVSVKVGTMTRVPDVALKNGLAKLTLRHLGHRRLHVVVTYSGSATALPSTTSTSVDTR